MQSHFVISSAIHFSEFGIQKITSRVRSIGNELAIVSLAILLKFYKRISHQNIYLKLFNVLN